MMGMSGRSSSKRATATSLPLGRSNAGSDCSAATKLDCTSSAPKNNADNARTGILRPVGLLSVLKNMATSLLYKLS